MVRVRETTRLSEKVTIPITTQWSNNPTAINFVFSLLFVVFGNIEVHTKIFSTHSYAGDSTVDAKDVLYLIPTRSSSRAEPRC